jgi:hypothetical protein
VKASNAFGETLEASAATAVVTAAPTPDPSIGMQGPASAISDLTITTTPIASVSFPASGISSFDQRLRLTNLVRVIGVRGAGVRPSGQGGGGI